MRHIYEPRYYHPDDPACPYSNYDEECNAYDEEITNRAEEKNG